MIIVCAALGSRRVATAESSAIHNPVHYISGRFFLETDLDLTEISSITAFCLGCHDGTVAPARHGPVEPESQEGAWCNGTPGLHPVDTVYPDDTVEYAPRALLPSRMLMPHGRVTCVACHDLEAKNHELVIPNRRSALCLTCHRK